MSGSGKPLSDTEMQRRREQSEKDKAHYAAPPMADPPPAKEPPPLKQSHPLPWLRAVGAGSLSIGAAVGIMSELFWAGTILFLVGLVILFLDLTFEPIAQYWKVPFGLLIIAGAVWFVFVIVLRHDALDVEYRLTDTNFIELFVRNGSTDTDYKDIDLTLSVDSHDDFFDRMKNISSFPSLTVVDPSWRIAPGETAMMYLDVTGWREIPQVMRVACSLLPKRSTAHAMIRVVTQGNPLPAVATDWKKLMVYGSYRGRFRSREVSIEASKLN